VSDKLRECLATRSARGCAAREAGQAPRSRRRLRPATRAPLAARALRSAKPSPLLSRSITLPQLEAIRAFAARLDHPLLNAHNNLAALLAVLPDWTQLTVFRFIARTDAFKRSQRLWRSDPNAGGQVPEVDEIDD